MKHQIFSFKILPIVLLLTIVSSPQIHAQARGGSSGGGTVSNQFYFEETFFPVYVSKNDANSTAGGAADKNVPTESGLGFDMRTTLGWIWQDVLFGLTYNYYSVSSSRPVTADYEGENNQTSRQEYGPTVGYFLGSWRFALTYFLSADKTVTEKTTDPTDPNNNTDHTYKNTGGSGFQLAVGYDFELGAGFGISPTLAYRSVSYSKQSFTVTKGSDTPYPTTSLQTKAIDNEVKPMITVTFRF